MKRDIQKKINRMYKNFPKNYIEDMYQIVVPEEGVYFGKVKDIIRLLEDVAKTYDIEMTEDEIRKLNYEDLPSYEEVAYKDKIENIDILKKKIKNKELKEDDIINVTVDYMTEYHYIVGKKKALRSIKKYLGQAIEEEIEF